MGWTAYKLVYKAKSPLHIGWHTLGYIKLTRYYITGKAMWGAMTANITRARYGYEDYTGIGALLKEGILMSYFFPAVEPVSPLLPRFTNKGLLYGKDDMPATEFERLFIKSYGQTAVMPQSNTAEDETLHESEYISPYVEIAGKQCPVYFVGYILISDEANYNGKIDLPKIKKAISEIFVGGDRKYGWGRLALFKEPSEADDLFNCGIKDVKADNLEIALGLNVPIPAHSLIRSDVKIKGDIEPLVGREWGEVKDNNDKIIRKGFGQYVTGADICWVPGSILEEEKTLKIGAYGILK